jgi:chromosome segregation ATPase
VNDLVDRLESLLAWLQSDADNIHHLPRDQVQQLRDLLDKKPYAADRIAELEAERDSYRKTANDLAVRVAAAEARADRLSAMLKEAEEARDKAWNDAVEACAQKLESAASQAAINRDANTDRKVKHDWQTLVIGHLGALDAIRGLARLEAREVEG